MARLSRREVLKQLGAGAAAIGLPRLPLSSQAEPPGLAGEPAQLTIESVSPVTVRLTLRAVSAASAAIPFTGALERDNFSAVARSADAAGLARVRAGDLVVRLTAKPATHVVAEAGGGAR